MSNSSIRDQVTKQIAEAIESGKTLPWRRPWSSSPNAGRPTSLISRKAYTGVNPLLLQIHANRFGFSSKWWATFRTWESLGLPVKKRPDDVPAGSWGATIIYAKQIAKRQSDDDQIEANGNYFLWRTFKVFNADQILGAEAFQIDEPTSTAAPDFAPADELIAATKADIRHGGDRAFYVRLADYIQVPYRHKFDPPGAYYATLLHELAHWSELRLSWNHIKHGYPLGELVAEISAAYLSAELGIPQAESLESHAAYVQKWLDAMKGDASFVFKASTQASKVADFLLSFVRQQADSCESTSVFETSETVG